MLTYILAFVAIVVFLIIIDAVFDLGFLEMLLIADLFEDFFDMFDD